jgi:hypothetical protein
MALIEINRDPTPAQLRWFAGLWLPLFCGVLGAALFWKSHAPTWAVVVWAAGATLGIVGLLSPRLIKPVFVGLMYATFPLGWLLSYVVLGVLFYCIFTPIGLCLRLVKRDPLARRKDPAAKTYWQPRETTANIEQYFKQY